MKTILTLLFTGAFLAILMLTPAPASAQDDYWTSHWNWYDNTYRPYYYRTYTSPSYGSAYAPYGTYYGPSNYGYAPGYAYAGYDSYAYAPGYASYGYAPGYASYAYAPGYRHHRYYRGRHLETRSVPHHYDPGSGYNSNTISPWQDWKYQGRDY